MADYIDYGYQYGEDNWHQFRDSFENGFYKVGYMYPGSWCGGIYNGGAYEDDVIYAVMSAYSYESNKTQVWDVGDALKQALQY